MLDDLIHAGQFENQLTARLKHSLPFPEDVRYFPSVEVLDDVNRCDPVSVVRRQIELRDIALQIPLVQVYVDPTVPADFSASKVEANSWKSFFHADATVLGLNRFDTKP